MSWIQSSTRRRPYAGLSLRPIMSKPRLNNRGPQKTKATLMRENTRLRNKNAHLTNGLKMTLAVLAAQRRAQRRR